MFNKIRFFLCFDLISNQSEYVLRRVASCNQTNYTHIKFKLNILYIKVVKSLKKVLEP